ncbi:MAG: hypothetical protein KDA45_11355, partial [Planctomycetales bacterium]|nr:hypothetical protein [Planctomycetales bacterium]
ATSMMAAGFERGLEIAEKNGWAVLLVRPAKDTGEDARAGGGEGEARYETARSSTFPQPLEPQNITVR